MIEKSTDNLTFEFHNELNPLLWDGGKLKPEIKNKLLDIAEAFLDTIDTPIDIEDITLTGSLANYNYTKYSDFDLHIITDYTDYKIDIELLKDYFNAKKTVWNNTRDITIKGYDVEVYIQDINEPHHSTGVYSLKNDEWVMKPNATKEKAEIDLSLVNKKKQAMLDMINFALSDGCDVECADKAKEKFMELRKAGLDKGGEFSPENLAFKELRRSGDVERLVQGILAKKDKQLSLDSVQQLREMNFKSFMGITNKRGPRHQQLGAGMNKLASLGKDKIKSIGIVAQMHKRKKEDSIPVHNLKKKEHSQGPITHDKANEIITRYNLDINKIKSGYPRKLSTSNIEIGFDPQRNTFYLRKY